jgi:sodium-dependent dicarboxylate transporter 2/3/5
MNVEAEHSTFDDRRRVLGLWLAPLLAVVLLLAPLPLSPAAHRLSAVAAVVMTFWITEAIPLAAAALLVPTLAVLLGVTKAKEALAPFADPTIFLFLGSFLLAEALRVHGLDRRIALGILSLPGVARSPARVRLAVALVTAAISMWISNTATAAMMLPIALGLVRALGAAGSSEPPRATLLLVGMAASLGGVGTPVGTPPNLIALGFLKQAGIDLDFPSFMAVGTPLALALTFVTFAIVWKLLPPPPAGGVDVAGFVREERARLQPWGAGQTACATAFGLAVMLWLLPGLLSAGGVKPGSPLGAVTGRFEESVVALLAALLLFVWPVGDRRALGWDDAARIDWGTLMLFGGGLSLGKMMFDTGLADALGRGVLSATGVESLWGLTALLLALTIVLTETASNTATVSMLAPLAIALARQLDVPVAPPLLAVGFGASMGFMFPVGTPPNAIVYGTGLVPLTAMMRVGIVVDVVSFFVILATLRVMCPLLGLS